MPVVMTCAWHGALADSYKALEAEAEATKDNIERILSKVKAIFGGSRIQERLESNPDMDPDKIWSILSEIGDENLLVNNFNSLDEVKKREVAEYVLTKCSIFAGKASVFSSRYSDESGLMGLLPL